MKRYFWIGFGVWLAATLAIRFAGGTLFGTNGGIRLVVLFVSTTIVVGAAIRFFLRPLPTADARLRAAVLIVLPGILLDTGSVLWFPAVFPNLPAAAGMPFAALLLWAYGIALLAGAFPGGK